MINVERSYQVINDLKKQFHMNDTKMQGSTANEESVGPTAEADSFDLKPVFDEHGGAQPLPASADTSGIILDVGQGVRRFDHSPVQTRTKNVEDEKW